MSKKYLDNGFCDLFMNTYDYYTKEGVFKEELEEVEEEMPKKKFSLFRKEDTKKSVDKFINDITKDSQYQNLLDTKKTIMEEWFTASGISFSVLWDFIEFIDFAKKTILYEDKEDRFRSHIKIDTKNNLEHRYMSIQYTEITSFIFDLYYSSTIECIKITKIVNEDKYEMFISDGHIDFKDSSDIYLINTINYILCRECRRKMMIIYEILKSVFII